MNTTVKDGFPYYIELLGNQNYIDLLFSEENSNFLRNISEEKSNFRFADGKWNIKQIVGHLTDHERIMTYRLLRISRKDETILPGYDQEAFILNSRFENLSYSIILEDFLNVRKSTQSFSRTLSEEQLQLKGKIWKFEMTIEDYFKALMGHELHHNYVLKEKYLI
jgi:uncharacterized damage-inducible protein DinB